MAANIKVLGSYLLMYVKINVDNLILLKPRLWMFTCQQLPGEY